MDELTELLLLKADEKLEIAKLLIDQGYYADSICKSYYAMFYAAKALLANKGLFPKKT